MDYVEWWNDEEAQWCLSKMKFIKAFLCVVFGENVHYVPRSKINFY